MNDLVLFQALYLLLQCGHNVEEAIRRRKMQAVPPTGKFRAENYMNFQFVQTISGPEDLLVQIFPYLSVFLPVKSLTMIRY